MYSQVWDTIRSPFLLLGCGRIEQSYEAAGVATMGGAFGARAGYAYLGMPIMHIFHHEDNRCSATAECDA